MKINISNCNQCPHLSKADPNCMGFFSSNICTHEHGNHRFEEGGSGTIPENCPLIKKPTTYSVNNITQKLSARIRASECAAEKQADNELHDYYRRSRRW